uniref:Nuclear protein localization protein 4 homolog n=1 Tax=Cacopsylla melanoneura TaxID=428564 RepID=A0A8D8ZK58_9HEMI
MSNPIVLRVQSPVGIVKRVNVNPSDSCRDLYEKVNKVFELNTYNFALYKQRNKTDEIVSSREIGISFAGLKHGDFVYMTNLSSPSDEQPGTSSSNSSSNHLNIFDTKKKASTTPSTPTEFRSKLSNVFSSSNNIVEDEVDKDLWNTSGQIKRKRDEKLCQHVPNGQCIHCSPLEAYDEAYMREQNLKHMSFHAYLRKQCSGADRGKFVVLEDLSCRIKEGCREHPPWPRGICSKCQPNAITLNRQVYRHVDNVEFENRTLVERFLEYWRVTGHQRVGLLYGKYQTHPDVPLGIKAIVAAIYEPPQDSSRDKIKLLPDPKADIVDELASSLGLRKVGWIFTDLVADDLQLGTVKHTRNVDSHFLSAHECIMAGHLQNLHPNPCRFSPGGYFGSKFVTICVTGDKDNQVHMEGYGVSNQCMALVRDKCLIPTKDAPELGYIKESTDKQYVPDVFYKIKDKYGNEVSRLARPLPVEYLLVDIPAATPLTPAYTFPARPDNTTHFPVENRMVDGQIQGFNALSRYLLYYSYITEWWTGRFKTSTLCPAT